MVVDDAAMPTGPKSILFASIPCRYIWATPLPVLLALVETSSPVILPQASGSLAPSATVMSALPLNATPLMFRDVWKALAVVALPLSVPVIVPAENAPFASLATMALAALEFVVVVGELATFTRCR